MLENIDLAISTLKRLVIVNMYETKVKLKSYKKCQYFTNSMHKNNFHVIITSDFSLTVFVIMTSCSEDAIKLIYSWYLTLTMYYIVV